MTTGDDSTRQLTPTAPPIIEGIKLHLDPPPPPRPPWWLRRDVIEMAVVFVIAVLPALTGAMTSFVRYGGAEGDFVHDDSLYLWLIGRSFVVAVPVLYIMWRSHVGWAFFGMSHRPRFVDALIGAAVLIFDYMLYYALYYMYYFSFGRLSERWLHPLTPIFSAYIPTMPSLDPITASLAVLAAGANGFAEELVMRAYFIPRLEKRLRSTLAAIVITSVVFGLYHIYQGVWAASFTVVTGLILGWVFVRTRKLWPVFFAHMFMDLVPFLFWSS